MTQPGQSITTSGANTPDRLYVLIDGLPEHQAWDLSQQAVRIAQNLAPKLTGHSSQNLRTYFGAGFYGIRWLDPWTWYQEAGTKPRVMSNLAGKAQPLTEPVLTPKGWCKLGNLKSGDHVIGVRGGAIAVTGVFPQGEIECWRVTFTDGSSVHCNAEHLWAVRRHGGNGDYSHQTQIRSTEYLAARPKARWTINLPDPVRFDPITIMPLDPYFVGIFISEGCRGSSPTFAQKQLPVVDEVRKVLPDGVTLQPHDGGRQWLVTAGRRGNTINVVARGLRDLGLALVQDSETGVRQCPRCGIVGTKRGPFASSRAVNIHMGKAHGITQPARKNRVYGVYSFEKRIPEPAFTSSVQDRVALLQGMMDGDGSCPTQGAVKYHTSSPGLAEDVVELARSLGCLARVKPDQEIRSKARHLMYTVFINCPQWLTPFRADLAQKLQRFTANASRRSATHKTIRDIVPVGRCEMRCISVDSGDGLYLTNGYTPTHNTIPMWIDDPTGKERSKSPSAKVRVTASGKTQVLIFRRAAKVGDRKTVKRKVRGTFQMVDVPSSYPGAPGRITRRQVVKYPGPSSGKIAVRNIGVRWFNPGITPKHFLHHAILTVAAVSGFGNPQIHQK